MSKPPGDRPPPPLPGARSSGPSTPQQFRLPPTTPPSAPPTSPPSAAPPKPPPKDAPPAPPSTDSKKGKLEKRASTKFTKLFGTIRKELTPESPKSPEPEQPKSSPPTPLPPTPGGTGLKPVTSLTASQEAPPPLAPKPVMEAPPPVAPKPVLNASTPPELPPKIPAKPPTGKVDTPPALPPKLPPKTQDLPAKSSSAPAAPLTKSMEIPTKPPLAKSPLIGGATARPQAPQRIPDAPTRAAKVETSGGDGDSVRETQILMPKTPEPPKASINRQFAGRAPSFIPVSGGNTANVKSQLGASFKPAAPSKLSHAPQLSTQVTSLLSDEPSEEDSSEYEEQHRPRTGMATSSSLSEKAAKRKNIAMEILSTEETYVKALEAMVNGYYKPLLNLAETQDLCNVSKANVKQIFSNLEQILPMNQLLLSEIRDRLSSWHDNQLIGDIFYKTGPFFKIYNIYGNNYDKGQEVLTKCQVDASFNSQVEVLASQVQNVNLDNLLIQPIQRIPRYVLLINDLLSKTDSTHPDYNNLSSALKIIEEVMHFIDKSITESKNREQMFKFAGVKGAEAIIQPHRQLVVEVELNIREKDTSSQMGTIKKKFKGKGLFSDTKIHLWLFNDVMVHLKSTKSKKNTNVASTEYTWPLELVWVKDIPALEPSDPKMPYSFMLVGPREVYTLRFENPTEKFNWMKQISDSFQKCLTQENSPDKKQMVRYGSYTFPDKDRGSYKGWWKFGRIHGEGVYTFESNTYTGQFEYNMKSGTGTMELCTGDIYHGEWKDDMPHGFGTFTFSNKDRYEGEWKEGLRCGKGTHYYADGGKYVGEWSGNVPHGEGHYLSASCIYKGGWIQSQFHGSGTLISANGRKYEGEFKEGLRCGEGRMDYGNGDFYAGQWKDGKRHGRGMFFSATEGTYDGEFIGDIKEGFGNMQYKNGDFYSGHWKRGLYHGHGVLNCVTGGMASYDGTWENGLRHGKGTIYYRNGSKYEGHLKENVIHGNGVFTSRLGARFEGKWEDGIKVGKGVIRVGQSKFSANIENALLDRENGNNVFVIGEPPTIHLDL